MATQTPLQDENPTPLQIFSYFIFLSLLCVLLLSGTSDLSQNKQTIIPTQESSLISNPQIDKSEVPILDDTAPAMPVAMFDLENPNGWETPETVTLVGSFQVN